MIWSSAIKVPETKSAKILGKLKVAWFQKLFSILHFSKKKNNDAMYNVHFYSLKDEDS